MACSKRRGGGCCCDSTSGATETRRSVRGRHVCERKKGGEAIGLTKRGKGSKIMVLVDGHGTPLSVLAASASLGETSLLEPLLDQSRRPGNPRDWFMTERWTAIYRASDCGSAALELVCPHRKKSHPCEATGCRALPALRATLEDRTH